MFYMYIDMVENFKIIPGIKYEYKMNLIKNLPILVLKLSFAWKQLPLKVDYIRTK